MLMTHEHDIMSSMRHTDNPLTYTFSRPEAKRVLYILGARSPRPYTRVQQKAGIDPKTFKRITRRLAQFALIHQRAAEDAEFEDNRIRIALELTDRGREVLETLQDLDRVLEAHAHLLGRTTTEPLLVEAGEAGVD